MQQANGGDQNPPLPSQQQQQQQQWVQYQQQQQQWMAAMTYPAANMAMMQQQQMMMYPQHYMAYYQQQQYHQKQRQQSFQKQQQQQQQPKSDEDVRTIWVGDLQHWMDETYLHSCFALTGEVSSVKIIRNKQTGQPEGYGFVEFYSRETAEKILQSYNGLMMMPNTEHPFRLNWASFSAGDKRTNAAPDLSIFVGDLAPDVTDAMLQETFASRFSSIKGAKVVVDSNTGRSKGYGFVRFGDENEKTTAMSEMNGVFCSSRPMRISVATPKKSSGYQQQYSSQAMVLAGGHSANDSMGQGSQSDGELNNTTIFVGGVDSNVMEEDLRQPFLQFGEVVSVKIPVGKGCGFVQFATRKSAEEALQSLNGTVIGTQTVRLSWGRNQGNKQWRGDSSNRWSGAYHEGQGYGGYGYAASPNQVPNMYATAAASGAS